MDIAFSDQEDTPEMLEGPALLDFAEISPARLPVLALEQHIAEKVHAYVCVYSGGRRSSRVKDLIDLAMIESMSSVQAWRLMQALESTFTARATEMPMGLPAPPSDWRVPYRKLAGEVGLDPEIVSAHARVCNFINPILSGEADAGARWDPRRHGWAEPNV